MRPYLAILRDSFRESTHSRVLWILLGLILLVLLLLTPLTVTYPLTSQLNTSDIRDVAALAKALTDADDLPASDVRRAVWDRLEPDLQAGLKKMASVKDEQDRNEDLERRARRSLAEVLNEIIEDDKAFTEAQRSSVELPAEAQRLASGTIYAEQQKRLNRLVIEAGFPDQFDSRGGYSTQLMYLIWPLGDQIPFGRQQVENGIEFALAQFTNFFLGFIGVFAGILVTASIIPNTFDEGSIHLLISKPISRALLYLTKVMGGCWFVLMNSLLLIAGVYLIAGFRLGVWNHRLMLCVPLFLFSFLIYYSVSAFAGLVWRNTVVAIVMAILCWLLCTIVGTTRESIRTIALLPKRLAVVMDGQEELFSATDTGTVQRWMPTKNAWDEIFKEEARRLGPAFAQRNNLIGPVFDAKGQKLLAIEQTWGSGTLYQATAEDDWKRIVSGKAPAGCRHLVLGNSGQVFAIHRSGFSRLADGAGGDGIKLFGLALPGLGSSGDFQSLGPKRFKLSDRATACVDLSQLIAYAIDDGVLTRMTIDDEGMFVVDKTVTVGSEEDSFLVCASGDQLIVGDQTGRILVLSAPQLTVLNQYQPQGNNAVRRLVATNDGRWFAALFHNGHAWLYDAEQKAVVSARIPSQGNLSTVSFANDETLLFVDQIDRVRAQALGSGDLQTRAEPQLSILERVYRFVIDPLYRVFPKPGQLGETNTYLLTGSETLPMSSEQRDLRVPRPTIDPWAPVWSSGLFTALVLAFGCLYISRQEF